MVQLPWTFLEFQEILLSHVRKSVNDVLWRSQSCSLNTHQHLTSTTRYENFLLSSSTNHYDMRDLSNCPASVAANDDLPAGWRDNTTALCGISYPEQILTDLSACCDGPVEISNGCFQFCATSLDGFSFHQCAQINVDVDPHFISGCNKAAARKPVNHLEGTDSDESVSWFGYLLQRAQQAMTLKRCSLMSRHPEDCAQQESYFASRNAQQQQVQ